MAAVLNFFPFLGPCHCDIYKTAYVIYMVFNMLNTRFITFVDHSQIWLNHNSAVIDFSRQYLTSADVRFWRLKSIPAL